ncbi:hypothetical protein QUF58_14870 [Anaerolineales bacterium HSG24]|nr:hypothetical protein [Anaerolineales bacterium HSG24]
MGYLPVSGQSHPEIQHEILTWENVDQLIDHLIPQLEGEFDGLLMITSGGLIPGGILSEALGIKHVLTASVYFPDDVHQKLAWPTFVQFPPDTLLTQRRILIVDNIWSNGRATVVVQGRLAAVGAEFRTAVLHYRLRSNLFPGLGPNYYGAVTERYIVYPWETSLVTPTGTGSLPAI